MSTHPSRALLDFWFGQLNGGFSDDAHRRNWFSGGLQFDEICRASYSTLAESAAEGDLVDWLDSPDSRLAFILLCDQLPRNLYRGEARAFATDSAALHAARTGVEAGMDRDLQFDERAFFYMPFEHSESMVDQQTCVGLFSELRDETPDGFRQFSGNFLQFAHQHRDLLRGFGRFPHRNAVLGRKSTADELTYLADGNDFGQSKPQTKPK